MVRATLQYYLFNESLLLRGTNSATISVTGKDKEEIFSKTSGYILECFSNIEGTAKDVIALHEALYKALENLSNNKEAFAVDNQSNLIIFKIERTTESYMSISI